MNKFYAQLYSVKDYIEKDLMETLEAIAKMGYAGVEFAGYGNYSATEIRTKLDELGLSALSAHVSLGHLTNNLEAEIKFLKILGAKYIVCPFAEINTVKTAFTYVDIFNDIGEKCAKEGLVFAYHNHAHELVSDDGQYPLEVLFDLVKPEFVKQQPDLYWIAYAGLDPIEYLKENKDRCPLIHLKQMQDLKSKKNVEAGKGVIDFAKAMSIGANAEFIYEQEYFEGTSLEGMASSIKFLNSKGDI